MVNRRHGRHGSRCITRTCSIAIHRCLIYILPQSIPIILQQCFHSCDNNLPRKKSLLPTPYRASSRAGKTRLLTATHGCRTTKKNKRLHVRNLKPRHTLAWPNPSACSPHHRLAGRPPFPLSRQTSHRSAALSRAAQHISSSGTASGPRLTF